MYAFSIRCAASGSPRCPAHEDVPTGIFSSNPFDFKQFRTLLRNRVSPTPFPSITSALFPRQWKGEDVSCPSARHSSLATVSPVFATHPKNRLLTPLFATHPKTASRKSLVCHTYDTPRGCVPLFSRFGTSSIAQSQGKPCCLFGHEVTSQESRVTHRSHCMRSRAVPQLPRTLAMCESSTGKHLRLFRCLNKESGQGFGMCSTPGPNRRSILNGDVGRPESNL